MSVPSPAYLYICSIYRPINVSDVTGYSFTVAGAGGAPVVSDVIDVNTSIIRPYSQQRTVGTEPATQLQVNYSQFHLIRPRLICHQGCGYVVTTM